MPRCGSLFTTGWYILNRPDMGEHEHRCGLPSGHPGDHECADRACVRSWPLRPQKVAK